MKMTVTKKTIIAASFALLTAGAFAEKAPVYISPNNDGVQDTLDVPLQIKEKRYVSEWSFTISDESGKVVRTIGNKEKRPDRITFKTFFKSLFTPKTGVTIPASVTWNGVLDDGSIAKDGIYYYQFSAADDNGNTATTSKLQVVVDNTAPVVNIHQLSEGDKIFGEGAKAALRITQDGSEEDLWIAPIYDAAGKIVRTFKWEKSEPLTVTWDGTDDAGATVADGVYTYKISATDRAGNVSEPAQMTNIIYSAEKPATNIAITGSRYFSPNGDGVKDTMTFSVTIPVPESKSNALTSWKVAITDAKGTALRSFTGTTTAPDTIVFDGKTDNGTLIPEGEYQAQVTAKYLNGYEPVPLNSPVFVMDITAPTAVVRASGKTFSPDGDGNLDTLSVTQQTSTEKEWTGKIISQNGTVVKQYDFGETAPSSIIWDGVDNNGGLAKDGTFYYELSATDLAGNTARVATDPFTLDTSKTEIILSASLAAFSPNGDKVQDTITFTPVVKTQSGVDSYVLSIINVDSGKTVKTVSDKKSLPATFIWNGLADDGTRCADGTYYASLATVSKNGSEAKTGTQPFALDTVAPSVELSVPYTVFSPDKDGVLDTLPVTAKSSSETKWTGTVSGAKGVVKTFTWQDKVPSFNWDGTDENGNVAANGSYTLTVSAVDAAGNKGTSSLANLTLDTRETKAYITTALDGISPNGDGVVDAQQFNVKVTLPEGISSWTFAIVDAGSGAVAKQWTEKDSKDLPATFTWDGRKSDGTVGEGTFSAKLHLGYVKGNVVDAVSSSFICTATPPALKVRTAPEYFSPDNDGENDDLFIQLKGSSLAGLKNWSFTINDPNNGHPFWKTSGKATITEKIIWDGRGNNGELVQSAMDYPYEFTATDELGMTSTVTGKISVDILVIRVGDVLKMQVPSIIFRSNNADFKNAEEVAKGPKADQVNKGLDQSVVDNNVRVLKRIAEILNKFKDYTVTIEGHANNVSGTEDEETSTANGNIPLEPLSKARAEFVRQELIMYGVDGSRLTAVGRGGRQPVVARADKDNWWKNRRVEFILNK
jgi:flagellar hook assembly protein FlgD